MTQLISKLPQVGLTIFSQMAALANKHQAINLAQGFPNFACPDYLLERAHDHLNQGANQYAPMSGIPELRNEIKHLVARQYALSVDMDTQITITSGATEALMVAIQAIVGAGDEVIIFDPAYDSYQPAIALTGGKAVSINLDYPEYKIDWQAVRNAITAKTKAIIINTPHNPSGSVLSEHDFAELKNIVLSNDLYLISDEVYEHIIFDGKQHLSVLRDPELLARSFVISSFGKTFHVTGWKIGYCIAPEELSKEFRKIHQYTTFSSATPLQYAIADMLKQHPQHINELADLYQEKRDTMQALLADSRFDILPCSGTYFQLVDYSRINAMNDLEFCTWLTKEHGVASIPLSPFYQDPEQNKVIRLCFAKDQATLERAAEALAKV